MSMRKIKNIHVHGTVRIRWPGKLYGLAVGRGTGRPKIWMFFVVFYFWNTRAISSRSLL